MHKFWALASKVELSYQSYAVPLLALQGLLAKAGGRSPID